MLPDSENCWYCFPGLCYECWDNHGHCGHKEATAQDERARNHKPGDPVFPIRTIEDEVN